MIKSTNTTDIATKHFVKETIEKTKEQGFCETIFGRKRFLPEINSKDARIRAQAERIARNFPVQGTAADIMKMVMVELKEKKLLNNNCRLLLQIHDELLFEVKENIADKIKQPIEEAMENAVALKVPMKVKINKGVDWGKV